MSLSTHIRKSLFVTIMAALVLSGCDEINGVKNEEAIHKVSNEAPPKIEESAGKTKNALSSDPLTVSDEVWVGNEAVRMRRGQPLPSKFEGDKGFTLVSAAPMSLSAIASEISTSTGVPVRVTDMSMGADTGGTSTDTATMALSYEGSLTTFLDQVASQFDVSWRYDGQTIYLYRYETKTFTVESMPGKNSLDDSYDNSSSSSSSSSSSTSGSSGTTAASAAQDIKQRNDLAADMDYWKDLEAAVKGILGTQGTETMMPSSGTITISARPAKLAQLAEFLDQENKRLSRQVAIDLVVYSVTLDRTNSYGLNLTNVFNKSLNTVNSPSDVSTINLTGPSIPSASSFTTATAGTLSIALLSPHWNLDIVPQALSAIGNVSEVTRSPVVTLNNRPASREITVDQAYLASISTTLSGLSGTAQTSLTPGVVTTGITLQVLPRILDDGRILLQYSLKLSDLLGITNASNGQATSSTSYEQIQTPETSSKIFVQQAVMQNGSTLVLAGFDQDNNTDNTNGIGSPSNWILGGGTANNHNHQQLVITITPREVTPERGGAQSSS